MKKIVLFCLIISVGLSMLDCCEVEAQNYTTVFSDDFEDVAESEKIWTSNTTYSFTDGYSGTGLHVSSTSESSSVMLTAAIPAESVRNCTISLSAMVRGENVAVPAQSWLGMKVMLVLTDKYGVKTYPQLAGQSGTFDWQSIGKLLYISPDVIDVELIIGIQQNVGELWFDNLKIQIVSKISDMPPARDPQIPVDKNHPLKMSRGMNVSPQIDQASLDELGIEWQANHIRWQLGSCNYPDALLRDDYKSILKNEIRLLDSAVKWCEKNGLRIIVDLHSLSEGLFTSKAAQTRLINTWKRIALRYKNNEVIWAYDLANEPNYNSMTWPIDDYLLWNELADKLVRKIREIDPVKPIIIENLNYLLTFDDFKPIDFNIPNIIYSIHFYDPWIFTHQSLYGNQTQYTYPGTIAGKYYDKNTLKQLLKPIKDFQDKYRVPIYVGEFSAIRWAPDNSADNYIRDCLEIFEEYGWDWSYHAFREWHGWSVEHNNDASDTEPSVVPTERENLLRSYFIKHEVQ